MQKIELFNFLRSFAYILNQNYATLNYPLTPGQTIIFLANGNLFIKGLNGQKNIVISCPDFPYRALMEFLNKEYLKITRLRLTALTTEQLNQDIIFNISGTNGTLSEPISPLTYFNPSQFQSRIIDIPMDKDITADTAIVYAIGQDENININFQCVTKSKEKFYFTINIKSTNDVAAPPPTGNYFVTENGDIYRSENTKTMDTFTLETAQPLP